MQGFLFSKPVLPEQLADLLRGVLSASPPLQPELDSPAAAFASKKTTLQI